MCNNQEPLTPGYILCRKVTCMNQEECIRSLWEYCVEEKTWDDISEMVNTSDINKDEWYIWPSGHLLYQTDIGHKIIISAECKSLLIPGLKNFSDNTLTIANIMIGILMKSI